MPPVLPEQRRLQRWSVLRRDRAVRAVQVYVRRRVPRRLLSAGRFVFTGFVLHDEQRLHRRAVLQPGDAQVWRVPVHGSARAR